MTTAYQNIERLIFVFIFNRLYLRSLFSNLYLKLKENSGVKMKKILNFLLVLTVMVVVTSCGSRQTGQLIGVQDRPSWKGINPYGMVYVPSGTLHIGPSDQDVSNTFIQRPKTISIQGFYMDDTEITNNEYRQFVYWVRDSLAHDLLEHTYEDDFGNEFIDWEYENRLGK